MANHPWHKALGVMAVALAACQASVLLAQSGTEWQSSAWHLWLIDVDGTNLQPIDTTPNARCGSPVWSPDGQHIVYDVLDSDSGGFQVATIRADGTDRQVVCRGSLPSWSPDGTQIACQGDGLQVLASDGTGRETHRVNAHSSRWSPRGNYIASGSGSSLWIYDLETGSQRMASPGQISISHGFGISPDGTRFCLGTRDQGLWIATFDLQTTKLTARQVVDSGTVYHASWAPDGKRVVFAWRRTPAAKTQLYTMDVDADAPPALLPGIDTSHQNVNPAWSPDGRTIVFSAPAALSNLDDAQQDDPGAVIEPARPLFTIRAEGGTPRQVTHATDRICGSPDWSADGKWIAYDSWRTSQTFQAARIVVMREDGTDARDLGPGNMPSWSPDGTLLTCFTYRDSSGNSSVTIDVLNSDGTGRETLLNHWGCPRWSPRGNRIATIATNGSLALLDLATGQERSTFGGPYQLRLGIAIDSVGRRFCFSLADGGIALATLDERTMRCTVRPLITTGTCHQCSFAPDGKRVVMSWQQDDEARCQLFILNVDGNNRPENIVGQDVSRNNCDPDWSPDGKTIAYVSQLPAAPAP